MDLLGLLKHFSVSRSVVYVAFLTSCILLFGDKFKALNLIAVPQDLLFYVQAISVFTGLFSLVWLLESIINFSKVIFFKLSKCTQRLFLDQYEKELLNLIALKPNKSLDISKFDYNNSPISHLGMMNIADKLVKKGFINPEHFNNEAFYLTDDGKKKALKIQNKTAK